ncbi:hypothetical protein OG215_37575 (plasmid) [Streptomyces globisporus]|uniref:hypothetical protein n=1 Tax=Streptomyces globisporus TaxID=1908 RepID=UPI002F90C38D|nr:hypothetical protein OG215_37575 [Streptomyces globisporus]
MSASPPASPKHLTPMRGAARRNASTITDPELDRLYAQLDYLLLLLAAARLSADPQVSNRARRTAAEDSEAAEDSDSHTRPASG